MENDEYKETEGTYTQETSLGQFVKAEIDTQIATAKAFPRSLANFRQRALSMATFSEDVAASCEYALPRRERDKSTGQWVTKTIDGPSVRLAEIVNSAYGNTRSGSRVIDNDGRTITAQGICHDLETNVVVTIEVKRRITTSRGETYNEDMQVLTGNAAAAIAFRNAIFKVIPGALVADLREEIRRVAVGDAETLIKRRNKAILYFTEQRITPAQIFEILGVKSVEDIDLNKLSVLSGMRSLVRNGEGTLAELFNLKQAAETAKDKGNKATDATTAAIKKATKPAPKVQPKPAAVKTPIKTQVIKKVQKR